MNRLAEKARQQLLLPGLRKNSAERAQTLKHDPVAEYQSAAYILDHPDETLLGMPGGSFKGAMAHAAIDMPGKIARAQIGRLTAVPVELVPVYGIPRLLMSITRNSDFAHTPDVRTRVILERWALVLPVTFITPNLSEAAIVRLLAAGGMVCGVGDYRVEKGAGSYGQFRICEPDDEEFAAIREHGGRAAQTHAIENPMAYNNESAELLTWFTGEVQRRYQHAASPAEPKRRRKPDGVDVTPGALQ
jgi:hypothetical protein